MEVEQNIELAFAKLVVYSKFQLRFDLMRETKCASELDSAIGCKSGQILC